MSSNSQFNTTHLYIQTKNKKCQTPETINTAIINSRKILKMRQSINVQIEI